MNLICIKKLNTGTGTVELHILSSQSNYQNFTVQTGTPITLAEASNFDWAVDLYRNLVCIKKSNTVTGTVELHILSSQSNYQNFTVQTGTPITLAEASSFDWAVDAYGNLVCMKKSNTASGRVEGHVLSAQSNYQNFVWQTATPITLVDATNFDFRANLASLVSLATGQVQDSVTH